MRSTLLYAIAIVASFSTAALAASRPDASVGWYFDDAGVQSCMSSTPFVPLTAYLCLKNTGPFACVAWELRTDVFGNCAVTDWGLASGSLNVLSPPEFAVGVSGSGLLSNEHGVVVLAQATLIPLDGNPISLAVLPTSVPTFDGFMAFVSAGDLVARPMRSDSDANGIPTMWINSASWPCAVTHWDPENLVTAKFAPGMVAISNPLGGDLVGNIAFGAAALDSLMSEYQVEAAAKLTRAAPDTVNYVVSVTNELRTSYLMRDTFEFAVADSALADDFAAALSQVEGTLWARAPYVHESFQSSVDPYRGPHVEGQGFERAWAMLDSVGVDTSVPSMTVGLIDSGVDMDHLDLQGLVTANHAFWEVYTGHGTAVAGVIAAKTGNGYAIAGGAPVRLRSYGFNPTIPANHFEKAIQYLLPIEDLRIANYSYGGGVEVPGQRELCAQWYNANRILVAAPGNYGLSYVAFPAAYPSCWAVGGVTNSMTRAFPAVGPEIDFGAFSSQFVLNVWPSPDTPGCQPGTGTSYAAPVVASAASMLLMVRPELFNDDVYNILAMTARTSGLDPAGRPFSHAFGHGLVRAGAAIEVLLNNRLVSGSALGVSRSDSTGLGTLLLADTPDFAQWPTGQYEVTRVRCEVDVQFPVTFVSPPRAWGRGVGTDGMAFLGPQEGGTFYLDLKRHCEVLDGSASESGCTLETYLYRLERVEDHAVSWYPVAPSELTWSWAALGKDWVSDVEGGSTAVSMSLSAAPSPFNAQTVISLRNSQSGRTEIAIYDLAGRRVAVLHDGALPEGLHTWIWDGRDTRGRDCASSVYLVRAQAPEGSLTRSVVLVK